MSEADLGIWSLGGRACLGQTFGWSVSSSSELSSMYLLAMSGGGGDGGWSFVR